MTLRLVKRFPVLYQDYRSHVTQTCMCWGFEHGDGWFEIIWQLSLAIEEELNYSWLQERRFLLEKGLFRFWNTLVYKLSPIRHDRRKQEGSGTKEDPYRWVVVEQAPPDCLTKLARRLLPRCPSDHLGSWLGKLQRLGFKAFAKSTCTGLAVQQVKEKFGTLRFYCSGTEAIDKYIHLAERLSAITCESCGKPGKANDSGRIRTLCDSCRNNDHLQ